MPYEEKGREIGKLVAKKQQAYGKSVEQTFELMKVFLKKYKNENDTYTIPESLLKHILLQVRIIDKLNRIFNNPDKDLLEESPYDDLIGYSILGSLFSEDEVDGQSTATTTGNQIDNIWQGGHYDLRC